MSARVRTRFTRAPMLLAHRTVRLLCFSANRGLLDPLCRSIPTCTACCVVRGGERPALLYGFRSTSCVLQNGADAEHASVAARRVPYRRDMAALHVFGQFGVVRSEKQQNLGALHLRLLQNAASSKRQLAQADRVVTPQRSRRSSKVAKVHAAVGVACETYLCVC